MDPAAEVAALGAGAPDPDDDRRFEAPDGALFATERDLKRHVWAALCTCADRTGETWVKRPGEATDQPIDLLRLRECTVRIVEQVGMMAAAGGHGIIFSILCCTKQAGESRTARASLFEKLASQQSTPSVRRSLNCRHATCRSEEPCLSMF